MYNIWDISGIVLHAMAFYENNILLKYFTLRNSIKTIELLTSKSNF
jgi:hypothetical protein